MLIALLKKLAVPVPIIGVVGAGLIRFERQRQEKRTAKAVMYQPMGPRGRRPPDPLKRRLGRESLWRLAADGEGFVLLLRGRVTL